MRSRIFALAFALGAMACGGNGGAPPTPVPTGVTISGAPAGHLFLGESYTFTMNVQMSNGTSVTTGGTWGSDAPAVATVNAVSGAVQIVGVGEATIYVDYQGQRGTRRVVATVRYEGQLNAAVEVTGCTDSGVWATEDACDEYPKGDIRRLGATFSQSDRTVTVTTELADGFVSPPVSTTIAHNGELRFSTTHSEDSLVVTSQWVLRPSGLTQVAGTIASRFRVLATSGNLDLKGNILPTGIARTSLGGDVFSLPFLGDVTQAPLR